MASQEIGSLFVALGLDSAVFTAGVKQVQSAAGKLQKGLEGIATRAEAMGKKLSVVSAAMAAVGLAVGGLVKHTAAAASEISKQSAIANATTDEFQKWAKGSAKVGISQEKLADILKDVNDRVGEFNATGAGPMKDFFEQVAPKVGVTAEQFKNLSGPQALQLYVSSLEKAGLSQQEMTFYLEAMASDATALIPLLRNGGAEMTRLGDAAANAGAVMSPALIGMSKTFTEKMAVLMQSLEGVRNRLAEALLPVVNRFIDALITYGVPALNAMVGGIEGLIQWFGNLSEPVQLAAAGIAAALGVGGPVLLAVAAMSTAFAAIVASTGPIGLFIAAAAAITAAWSVWGDDIKAAVGAALDWLQAKFDALVEKLRSIVDWAGRVKTAITDALAVGRDEMNSGEGYGGMGGAMGDPAAMFGGGSQSTGRNVAAGILSGFETGMASGGPRVKQAIQSGLIDTANDTLGIQSPSRVFMQIGKFVTEGLGLGLQDGIPGVQAAMAGVTEAVALDGVEGGLFKFRDAARDVFSQVAFQGQKLGDVLRNRLASWASNAAGNLFSSGFNQLWSGLGLPSFATGTNYFAGGLARINERGGEIVNLPSGAQVIPHDVSMRMADRAGSADRLHVTVAMDESTGGLYAMVQDAAGREIARAAPVIVRESVKASAAASRATKGTMGVR